MRGEKKVKEALKIKIAPPRPARTSLIGGDTHVSAYCLCQLFVTFEIERLRVDRSNWKVKSVASDYDCLNLNKMVLYYGFT